MANDLIKYALLAGGAYLIYQEFFSTPAAATTTTPPADGTTTPPPASTTTPPPYQYNPPTLVQQLQNAAGAGVTVLNADQWQYYWMNTLKKPQVDQTSFDALFFPQGRPSDPAQNPTMTANQFVAALATKGISGYGLGAGTAQPLWLPVIMQKNGYARRPMVSNYRRRTA
jgi:hypothetical protein